MMAASHCLPMLFHGCNWGNLLRGSYYLKKKKKLSFQIHVPRYLNTTRLHSTLIKSYSFNPLSYLSNLEHSWGSKLRPEGNWPLFLTIESWVNYRYVVDDNCDGLRCVARNYLNYLYSPGPRRLLRASVPQTLRDKGVLCLSPDPIKIVVSTTHDFKHNLLNSLWFNRAKILEHEEQ